MATIGKLRLGALTLIALSTVPLAARAQDAPPPADNAAPSVTPGSAPGGEAPPPPPAAQPAPPPPDQPSSPPAGQGPPPGYAAPGYAPGYAPPGYPPGYAPPPPYVPPAPTEPTHGGVYLHLHLGGGFTSIKGTNGSGSTVKLSGGGPSFAVAVGGAVAPNLALFGNFFLTMASQPQVSSNGYYGYSTQSSLDAIVGGLGGGVVYYFMPANVYISGAIGALNFQADDSNSKTVYTSDVGVGFQGLIGKEFWVSDHWGLGAALEFVGAGSMKDKDNPNISWSAAAFNLLFSATCF
jgi:hypothetical protein